MRESMGKEARWWQFDYIKAIGIILVILVHVWHLGYGEEPVLHFLFTFIFGGVIPVFMMITGYMYSASWERQGFTSIRQYYSKKNLWRKLSRIIVPFLMLYAIEIWWLRCFEASDWLRGKQILFFGLQGGFGPGSYYTPVLLQVVLLFPLLYCLYKKNKVWGSVAILTIQLLLDGFATCFLSGEIHRLLCFRYFIFLWAGMLFYDKREKQMSAKIVLPSILIGLSYLFLWGYTGYELKLFSFWPDAAMPALLWYMPVMIFLIKYMKQLPGILDKALCLIGKATFTIYLVQMFYYQTRVYQRFQEWYVQAAVSILVCVVIGVLFHLAVERLLHLPYELKSKRQRK